MPPVSPQEKTTNLNPMIEDKHETSTAGSARVPRQGIGTGFEIPKKRDVSRISKNSPEFFSSSRFCGTGRRRKGVTGLRTSKNSLEIFSSSLFCRTRQRREGIAGPSREGSKSDPALSGAVCAGQDDDELRWAQKHVPDNAADHRPNSSVFRKTELHHSSRGSPAEETAKARKRIRRNLDNPGSGVTLRPFETAVRDLVCSIIGQQDLAEEKLVLQIADLQQQIYDLQQTIATLEQRLPVQAPPPSATEKPEGYV